MLSYPSVSLCAGEPFPRRADYRLLPSVPTIPKWPLFALKCNRKQRKSNRKLSKITQGKSIGPSLAIYGGTRIFSGQGQRHKPLSLP